MKQHTFAPKNSLRAGLLAGFAIIVPAAPVLAQDAEGSADMDRIVITATPIRDSQAAAIEAKRQSDNVIDIVSADTIGRFPDQNLADSLGRVPGLAIERDQGQARYINFRGAPFRYTSIAFDGIDVPGAENGRIPRFDAFPSVITSRIEVNKAITADMPGEAVAGFVNIETFSPFDREGFSFSAEAGYGQQELGDQDIDKYNGRVSYSNDTFGISVFGSHNLRGRITDNREFELELDDQGRVIPNNLDFRSYRGDREDNAYGATVEVRPNADVRLFASTLYSEFIDREERNQYDFEIADGADISGAPIAPTQGYAPVVLVQGLLGIGDYQNSTLSNTLGADFTVGEWAVEARLNYTETENTSLLALPVLAGAPVAMDYDLTNVTRPLVTLFEPGSRNPIGITDLAFPVNLGVVFIDELNTDNTKFKLDAEREMELFGRDMTVRTGVQFDLREGEGGSVTNFGGLPINPDDFLTSNPWDTDFDNAIGGRNYDNPALYDAWRAAAGQGFIPAFDDDSLVDIEETIYAGYAMATMPTSWGNVVFGARVEATDFETSGQLVNDAGGISAITRSNDYVHILPNAHVNIDLSEDVKLRLSASTGVSRPTYVESRASIGVDPVELEASGGNPDLDAEFSWGGDVALEYYFAPASLFSVGAFARQVDNVIYPDTTTIDDGSVIAPGVFDAGEDVAFNSFFNGEDGELYGLELNFIGQATFLPGPFDGLGVSGNVTVLSSEFTAPTRPQGNFDLPGTSDLVYNLSVFYEKFGVSARVNYQYRDAWLSTTENDSLTEFWGETKRLDASIRYTLPVSPGGAGVTLFLNGNNLTDEQDTRYVNTPATPNQYEGFGRRFVGGVRIDF